MDEFDLWFDSAIDILGTVFFEVRRNQSQYDSCIFTILSGCVPIIGAGANAHTQPQNIPPHI